MHTQLIYASVVLFGMVKPEQRVKENDISKSLYFDGDNFSSRC